MEQADSPNANPSANLYFMELMARWFCYLNGNNIV